MNPVPGTPVNINGRTSGTPGPAPGNASAPIRVQMPLPPGRPASFTTFARTLRVRNLDGTNALRVYFLNDTYVTVRAASEEEFPGPIPFFSVQSDAAGTVQWEATAIVAG